MKRTTLFIALVGIWGATSAQPNLDSLYAVWQDESRSDSIRAAAYKSYVWDGYLYSDPDTAFLLPDALIAFGKERNNA